MSDDGHTPDASLTICMRRGASGVNRINRCLVGAAFVHRDFVQIAIRSHGLNEEALRRQQEVDGIALLIDSEVEVLLDALDSDVCRIRAPTAADRTLAFAGHFLDKREITN